MYFFHIPPTSYFRYVSILAAVTLFSAVPSLVIKFMAAPSDHWCARPDIMDVPMEERDFSPLAIQVLIIISLIIPIYYEKVQNLSKGRVYYHKIAFADMM